MELRSVRVRTLHGDQRIRAGFHFEAAKVRSVDVTAQQLAELESDGVLDVSYEGKAPKEPVFDEKSMLIADHDKAVANLTRKLRDNDAAHAVAIDKLKRDHAEGITAMRQEFERQIAALEAKLEAKSRK